MTVYTPNVNFTTKERPVNSTDYRVNTPKTTIYDCQIEQTNYGSVIVTRDDRKKLEVYPLSIETIVFD